MRRSFEEALANLQEDLLRLGHVAAKAIALSADALKRQDVELAEKVIAGDEPIDRLHLEIQNRCAWNWLPPSNPWRATCG